MRPENRGFPPNRVRTYNNRQRENLTGPNSEEIAVRRPRFRNEQPNQPNQYNHHHRNVNETNSSSYNQERGRSRYSPNNFQNRSDVDINKTKQPEREYSRNRRGRNSQRFRGNQRYNNPSMNNRRSEINGKPFNSREAPSCTEEPAKNTESLSSKESTQNEQILQKSDEYHKGKEISIQQQEQTQVCENVQDKHSTESSHPSLQVPAFDEPEDVISFHADEEDEMLLYANDTDEEQEQTGSHTHKHTNTNSYSEEAKNSPIKRSTESPGSENEEIIPANNEPTSHPTIEKKDSEKYEPRGAEYEETVASDKKVDSHTKRSSSHDSNHSQKRSRTHSPVPRPWTKVYSSKGELYFYNPETNESRWTIPEDISVEQSSKHDLYTPSDSFIPAVSKSRDQERRIGRNQGGDSWRPEGRKVSNEDSIHFTRNQRAGSVSREEKAFNKTERRDRRQDQFDVYRRSQPPASACDDKRGSRDHSIDRSYHQATERGIRQQFRPYSPERRLSDHEYSRQSNRVPDVERLPRNSEKRGRPQYEPRLEPREQFSPPSVRNSGRDFYSRSRYSPIDRTGSIKQNESQHWRYSSRIERDQRR